jgi:hypothetical protein
VGLSVTQVDMLSFCVENTVIHLETHLKVLQMSQMVRLV